MFEQMPQEATQIAEEVKAFTAPKELYNPITNHDEYELAATYLKQVKEKLDKVESVRMSITRPMDAAKKAVMDFFRTPTELLQKTEKAIKSSMIGWQNEVARLAKIEQDKIDAAAKAKAEAEKAELEAKAVELVQVGKIEQAEALVTKAETLQPEVLQLKVVQPKIAGIATKEIWRYRIVNPTLVPREYLIIDEKRIGEVARATKGMVSIPGVEFYSDKTIAA